MEVNPRKKTAQNYSELLKDPRWQKKRLEVMQRDEFTCQICYDSDSTLNVHHKHYTYGKNPWDYHLNLLVTLCESCHKVEGDNLKEAKQKFLESISCCDFASGEFIELSNAFKAFSEYKGGVIHSSIIAFFLENDDAWNVVRDMYFAELSAKRGSSGKN